MKNIMKRAWEFKKEFKNALFSECLKEAWKEVKEMKEEKTKKSKKTYSQYIKEMKIKDKEFFFGKSIKFKTNTYFTIDHVIDDDNIIIITSNIKRVKDAYVLVVANNKCVFLKDWQIRPVHNYYKGIYAYAVKLNRNYFKTYTFKNDFYDIYIEKEHTFDILKNVAATQTMEIAQGH